MLKTTTIRVGLLAVMLPLGGCAGSLEAPADHTNPARSRAKAPSTPEAKTETARSMSHDKSEHAQATLGDLPPAPWSGKALSPDAAPKPVVRAWRKAENRDRCAPVAPRHLGSGKGATPRVSELHGGWSVEFDKPGAAGIKADGTPCADCGRAAFGIAGTAMSPDQLTEGSANPTFRDGSFADIQSAPKEQGATAATLAIAGQDCVYQVWSFLGQKHVDQMVEDLRFVAVRTRDGGDRVAGLAAGR